MEELNIEEILQDERSDIRTLESSLGSGVFYAFYLTVLVTAGILIIRVLMLGVGREEFYSRRALANVNKEVYLAAPRGVIYDRFKNILAKNEPSFSVSLKLTEFRDHQAAIITFLKESIGITVSDINEAIKLANFEESDLVIVTTNLSEDDIIKLKAEEIPGLYIEDDFRRIYPYNNALAHVIGYVDADGAPRSGLEVSHNSTLQGKNGALVRQYNAEGKILDHKELRRSLAGKDVNTTLDAEFQAYFEKRLLQGLAALNRVSGVGIAVDPRNGEVLSLISVPAFDPNIFTRRGDETLQRVKSELLTSENKPLFNRAISGIYNPGSTVKPLVAVAALAENVISPSKKILSKGYIEIPNPFHPDTPSRFLDWMAHGWVDVRSALARSSNVYFYAVGGGFPAGGGSEIGGENMTGLGIKRLIKWWQMFGFGAKTGIDLLGESEGFIPNPDEKERRTGTFWRIGDTYNVSIGQGDLLVTPLQLINYISAIANGGTIYQLRIENDNEPKVLQNITGLGDKFKEVQEGMRDVVAKPYGTAKSFNNLPFQVAAKTGTAQIQNNAKINAFTVAYAPYENSEIAILVLVEDAREGSVNTIPIARDALEWYYNNRIKNLESRM